MEIFRNVSVLRRSILLRETVNEQTTAYNSAILYWRPQASGMDTNLCPEKQTGNHGPKVLHHEITVHTLIALSISLNVMFAALIASLRSSSPEMPVSINACVRRQTSALSLP
jgi:hypothetical protein